MVSRNLVELPSLQNVGLDGHQEFKSWRVRVLRKASQNPYLHPSWKGCRIQVTPANAGYLAILRISLTVSGCCRGTCRAIANFLLNKLASPSISSCLNGRSNRTGLRVTASFHSVANLQPAFLTKVKLGTKAPNPTNQNQNCIFSKLFFCQKQPS